MDKIYHNILIHYICGLYIYTFMRQKAVFELEWYMVLALGYLVATVIPGWSWVRWFYNPYYKTIWLKHETIRACTKLRKKNE